LELLKLLQNQIPGHADEPVRYAQLMETSRIGKASLHHTCSPAEV
jgi:hypothetical protein